MKNKLIFYQKSGDFILGEMIENSPAEIKVKILYPYYGISLTAKPKMCMLFSNKTYKTMGVKVLEKCFYLGEIISRKNEEIKEDFIALRQKLNTLTSTENSNHSKENLRNDFRIQYLNGFKGVPELVIHPLEGLLDFLKDYLDKNPQTKAIQPETNYSKYSERIINQLQEIKEMEINS